MTQIGRILCALCGGLIGYSITYAWCKIWDFIGRKRVEIPEIKYDVTDNPILTLKNRLGQAYVATYDRTVKKLLHRLLEYVEWIDNWHKEQVLIVENDRNGYKRKAERLQAEFESECLKNAELTQQLKSVGEKYVFCYNMLQKEMLSDWKPIERAENVREALCTPQDWQNTYGKKPIPVETVKPEVEALKRSIPMSTGAIIHIDSEDLNRYSVGRGPDGNLLKDEPTKNEEFIKQLRDWWGLEAQKAVELPKDEPPIYSEEFNKKLREIWFGVDNDTECHQYSVTVRKNGDCKEKKIVVLARSPIEAAKLVPKGYTVEGMSRLFE